MGGVGADFFESLEGADIKPTWRLGEHASSFGDSSGSGFFSFGRNNGSATFAFGFGLLSHGAFHVGREFDVLEFNILDVNAPLVGLGVNDLADLCGDLVAFAENFVEVEIASHVPKSSLGESAGGIRIVGSLKDGFGGVDNAEIDDSVDINSDIVASDNFLLRNVHRSSTNINLNHMVDVGDDDAEARLQNAREFTEAKHNAAFVLIDNTDARYND